MSKAYAYLLHFQRGVRQDAQRITRHYVGITPDVDNRLREHQSGRGSKLTQHIVKSGDVISLARVWAFGSMSQAAQFERKLKSTNGLANYCPACTEHYRKYQPKQEVAT